MGLTGSLRTLSLAEILQTLNRSQATGVLALSGPQGARDVVFSEGRIIRVIQRRANVEHSVLERLVAMGLIDESQAQGDWDSGSGGFSAIDALVSAGYVAIDEAEEAIASQTMDEIFDLFTWTNANFVFKELGSGDQEADQAVEQARQRPLDISTDSMLMESARRFDEWHRLKAGMPAEDAIVVLNQERVAEITPLYDEYPARAILPFLDGINSIDDVIERSVATRLDIYSILYDLLSAGLARILSLDEMISTGNVLAGNGAYDQAANVYRCILVFEPDLDEVQQNLAMCLQGLGDAPEAAECYGQLAISYLDRADHANAVDMARRAAQLDASCTQHLILIRCLVEAGDRDQAMDQLQQLVDRFFKQGRIDDARSTCLKMLQLQPNNENALRLMSRIYSVSGDDAHNEDIAVCVECGESNPRSRDTCKACGSSLHLACLQCGRVVAASDRICIFCGKDPHETPEETERRLAKGPNTDIILEAAAQSDQGKTEVESQVQQARQLEAEGRYREALDRWKSIARTQRDNDKLQRHIRDLEAVVHDESLEQLIYKANNLRKNRCFLRAGRAYKHALRGLSPDDARAQRLRRALASMRRTGRVISMIYTAAAIILLMVAWLVAEPWLALRAYREDVAAATARLHEIAKHDDPLEAYRLATTIATSDDLHGRAAAIGATAESVAERLQATYVETERALYQRALDTVEQAIADERWQAALEMSTQIGDTFTAADGDQRLATMSSTARQHLRQVEDRETRLAQDPELLEEALRADREGRAEAALKKARELTGSPHQETAERAANLAKKLEAERARLEETLKSARAQIQEDAIASGMALEELADLAQRWNREEERQRLADEVGQRLKDATRIFRSFGPEVTAERLQTFIERYAGTPEAGQAREMRADLIGKEKQRASKLAAYRAARERNDYREAFRSGYTYNEYYSQRSAADGIELPLVINTGHAGSEISIDGRRLGASDDDGRFVWWYPPGTRGTLTVRTEGYAPATTTMTAFRASWSWRPDPAKLPTWSIDLRLPVTMVEPTVDGPLLVGGSGLLAAIHEERVAWRLPLGDTMSLAGDARLQRNRVCDLGDGRLLVVLNGEGVVLVDRASGEILQRHQTSEPVRDVPAVYVNELLGGERRMACSAGALLTGPVTGTLDPIVLEEKAWTGPHVLVDGLDSLVIIGTTFGQLLAVDEAGRKVAWRHALGGTDIGRFLVMDHDHLATVVDGSRLVGVRISADGASNTWKSDLFAGGDLIDYPRWQDERLWVTQERRLYCLDSGGGLDQGRGLELPGRATCRVAIAWPQVVAAVAIDGMPHLIYYRQSEEQWRYQMPRPVQALAFESGRIIVGMEDGTVQAYEP